ncbi:MAG TPA: response regulator, partial [Steroidobacteraceae bacterium]
MSFEPVYVAAVLLGLALCAGGVAGVRAASRKRHQAERELDERRRSEQALKAALLRSEAAEAQLRRERNLMATVSSMARVGGWEIDLTTMTPIWSEEVYRIHEIDPSSRPSFRQALSFFAPEARPVMEKAVREALEHGTPYDLILPLITATGKRLWVRVMGVAEKTNGVVTRLSGAMQDVTVQHEAQARIARAARSSSEGHWEYELATGRVWVSEAFEELMGREPQERTVSIAEYESWYHPDDVGTMRSATEAHFESEARYDIQVRLLNANGEWRWFRSRGRAERDASGRPLRFSGSIQDVTEQRAAEEARIAARKAEEAASRAKGNFLANMSHEIRTPMNGVIGMTELLLDTPLQPAQREFAEAIRTSAISLLRIINDVLDYSKIDAGTLEIERVAMSVRDIVEDVGVEMAAQAAAKNLEFIVNVDPAVPDRMLGDPQRLRQVLMNLASNAVKFTHQGEVVIEVFPIALQGGRALLSFEVRDTGVGMPPETIPRLFQPFTQADASNTRQHGGTGLGLAIVSSLVTLMGGHVQVESKQGTGSVFSFTLPFDVIYDAAESSVTARIDPRGKRVLVMDDNPTNRRVLCGQLESVGYSVKSASTGAEAIKSLHEAQLAGQPFDIVIADDQMPDCDGVALAAQIRSTPELTPMHLVLLTSLDRDGHGERLIEAGFSGYLTKPVRGRELLACLQRVLEEEPARDSGRHRGLVTRGLIAADRGQGQYRGRVLVVEDNPVNQQVARRFLQRLGCDVTVVDNGAKAVETYRPGGFDLVLMDVQMPVMDGLTATRELRRRESS